MGVLLFVALLTGVYADNNFYLSRVFGDGMVLQANVPALVWGFSQPGSVITTTFKGQVFNTTTGPNFVWRQKLPAMPAAYTPYNMFFVCSGGGGSLSLLDVLFGEVFVCGGQSNMQMSMSGIFNATQEIQKANYPYIRLFTVGQNTSSATPLSDLKTVEQPWIQASPQSVSDGKPFGYFSAICFLFARDLHLALKVPVGAISDNWGGTCLEAWAMPEVSEQCGVQATPQLWNAMIRPYAVGPMAIAGFLWSQGECNADSNTTAYYACAFAPFINSWREQFNIPNAFFGFELLPAIISDAQFSPVPLPFMREAQLTGLNAGGRVAVVNAMDLGDPTSPYGSVHPRNKQTVASRFAAAALTLSYGKPQKYLSPAYSTSAVSYNGLTITVTVSFDPASLSGDKLVLVPAACPDGVPAWECAWDEIQTDDGEWHNASVSLSPDSLQVVLSVTLEQFMYATATRGTFSPWPVVHIFTSSGLPALPWNQPIVDAPCLITVGGKTWDFTALQAQSKIVPFAWIDTTSPPQFEYDFTFCATRTRHCQGEGNLCQISLSTAAETSLGTWVSDWQAVDNGIQAVFESSPGQTTVTLSCKTVVNNTSLVSVNQTAKNQFSVLVQLQHDVCVPPAPTPPSPPSTSTPTNAPSRQPTLAPTKQPSTTPPTYSTPCIVRVDDKDYDFTSLEARSAMQPFAWIDQQAPPQFEFDLTFCRARTHLCDDAGNVCQITLPSAPVFNDGEWLPETKWQKANNGLQTLLLGQPCGQKNEPRQTNLTLLCTEQFNDTKILSVTETATCQFTMLVQLESLVCFGPPTPAPPPSPSPTLQPTPVPTTPVPTPIAPCVITVAGLVYNLTSLEAQSAIAPYNYSDKNFDYEFTFCRTKTPKCGADSNICQIGSSLAFSLGQWNDTWSLAESGIQSVFIGGDKCDGSTRQSVVTLLCKDYKQTAVVSVVEREQCDYSVVVELESGVCPLTPAPSPHPTPQPTFQPTYSTPCVVNVNGQSFDFSKLEIQSSRIPLQWNDTQFQYELAICRSHTKHCDGNTSICQVSLTDPPVEASLGVWAQQWNSVDRGIQSVFLGGAPCGASKTRQTTVTFSCQAQYNQTSIASIQQDKTNPCLYTMLVQLEAAVCFAAPAPTPSNEPNEGAIALIVAGSVLLLGAVTFLCLRKVRQPSEGYRPI